MTTVSMGESDAMWMTASEPPTRGHAPGANQSRCKTALLAPTARAINDRSPRISRNGSASCSSWSPMLTRPSNRPVSPGATLPRRSPPRSRRSSGDSPPIVPTQPKEPPAWRSLQPDDLLALIAEIERRSPKIPERSRGFIITLRTLCATYPVVRLSEKQGAWLDGLCVNAGDDNAQ